MVRQKRIQVFRLYPDLSPGEAHLLSVAAEYPEGIKVSALAEKMELPMPAVSRLMRGMEEDDLIRRSILPRDRRNIIVTVTKKGLAVHEELMSRFHVFFQELLAAFSPEELERMLERWNGLMDRMELLVAQQAARPKIEPMEDTE